MTMELYKNNFSLIQNRSIHNNLIKPDLYIKSPVSVNILDKPCRYTISIFIEGLLKDSIYLSYINNFLVIDFKFRNNNSLFFTLKRTFYLKNIDISKAHNLYSSNLIYITLPKNSGSY